VGRSEVVLPRGQVLRRLGRVRRRRGGPSYGLLYWLGLADAGDADLAAKLVAISAACAAVEVAPWLEWADDNLTVPLAGAVLAYALL